MANTNIDIVFCKDCERYDKEFLNIAGNHKCTRFNVGVKPDDYCSRGKRKDCDFKK